MVREKKEENTGEDREPELYEFGYHLLSTVHLEDVPAEVIRLKDAIETRGGAFVSEETPKQVMLAYPIAKSVNNKRQWFGNAFFGWMRFRMLPEKAHELKSILEKDATILRFLLFRTTPELPPRPKRMPFMSAPRKTVSRRKVSAVYAEKPTISEQELDRTIEELIVE